MKKVRTTILIMLLGFTSQAQDFDLKDFLRLNDTNEAVFNDAEKIVIQNPLTDSVKAALEIEAKSSPLYRTGYPVNVNISLREELSWTNLANGMSIGVVKISCVGAKYISLQFEFNIFPETSKVYFTSPDIREELTFPDYYVKFLKRENSKSSSLGRLNGAEGYLIIIIPTADKHSLDMHIKNAVYGYASLEDYNRPLFQVFRR